MLGGHHRR